MRAWGGFVFLFLLGAFLTYLAVSPVWIAIIIALVSMGMMQHEINDARDELHALTERIEEVQDELRDLESAPANEVAKLRKELASVLARLESAETELHVLGQATGTKRKSPW